MEQGKTALEGRKVMILGMSVSLEIAVLDDEGRTVDRGAVQTAKHYGNWSEEERKALRPYLDEFFEKNGCREASAGGEG